MLAYILGYSLLNPMMASLAAVCLLIAIFGIWNFGWFLYLRRKMLNILGACTGIGNTLGMDEEELFNRALKAAKQGG